jgi:hypothetical protein
MSYPPELLRHQLVAVCSSVLLATVGVFALVYGWRSNADFAQGFMAFGVVFLLVGLPMAYLSTSWYRRAAQLATAGQGVPATVKLAAERTFDSTTLYAEVTAADECMHGPIRVAVLAPTWEYTSALGCRLPAALFIEPRSSLLKAISTERGMLWCIPHNVPFRGFSSA